MWSNVSTYFAQNTLHVLSPRANCILMPERKVLFMSSSTWQDQISLKKQGRMLHLYLIIACILSIISKIWCCLRSQNLMGFMWVWSAFFFFFFVFLGPDPWHMEVPKLGIVSELHLLAYATAAHSNAICELRLQPTPQLRALPVP